MDLIGTSWKEVPMPVPWERPPPEYTQDRICVVDDDEWVVDSLKLLLETFGFDVLSYTSGGEFFADARHRAVDCLVIDQHMPIWTASTLWTVSKKKEFGYRRSCSRASSIKALGSAPQTWA